MIRPLRRRHLWMVALVFVVVGALLVMALRSRPDFPLQDALPIDTEAPR